VLHAAELQTFAHCERLQNSLSTDATGISASLLERSQFAVKYFNFCNLLNANSEKSPALMG